MSLSCAASCGADGAAGCGGRTTVTLQRASEATLADTLPSSERSIES